VRGYRCALCASLNCMRQNNKIACPVPPPITAITLWDFWAQLRQPYGNSVTTGIQLKTIRDLTKFRGISQDTLGAEWQVNFSTPFHFPDFSAAYTSPFVTPAASTKQARCASNGLRFFEDVPHRHLHLTVLDLKTWPEATAQGSVKMRALLEHCSRDISASCVI